MAIRIFVFLVFMFCSTFAKDDNLVGGIVLMVNESPVTLYELKEAMKQKGMTKQKAEKLASIKVLREQEIKRMKISADEISVDKEIEDSAKSMGISRDKFVATMIESGYTYQELRDFYKQKVTDDLLDQKILIESLRVVDEGELRGYYDDHKKEFTIPKTVKVVQYVGANEKILHQAINNPFVQTAGVNKSEESVSMDSVNPQIAQMFVQTKKGDFTPILNNGNSVVTFYIKDKIGSMVMPFEQIRQFIAQQLVLSQKDKIIDEFFYKLLLNAKVTHIRKWAN